MLDQIFLAARYFIAYSAIVFTAFYILDQGIFWLVEESRKYKERAYHLDD